MQKSNINQRWFEEPVKGFIIDITGVLIIGDKPIDGSVDAIKLLKEKKIPFKLLTNETSKTIKSLMDSLQNMGFDIKENNIHSPIPAVIKIMKKENLRPYLLVDKKVESEFSDLDKSNPNCVILGDAGLELKYENLNKCFRVLFSLEKPKLFALGIGKYYMDEDGMSLDVGGFAKALEYATGVTAAVVGKPHSDMFLQAAADINLKPHEVAMIGDDIMGDIGGAQNANKMRGILVKTGKFRPSDLENKNVIPDAVVNNLLDAVKTFVL